MSCLLAYQSAPPSVKQNGLALKYASKELRDDKDVVLAAVRQNGQSIRVASARLKDDEDVAMAALEQNSLLVLDGW